MPHDWSHYLPEERRRQVLAQRRRLQRRQQLRGKRFWVGVCLAIYGLWCLALILQGNLLTLSFSLVPLLSMPAIAWLAWWLVYKEFHH